STDLSSRRPLRQIHEKAPETFLIKIKGVNVARATRRYISRYSQAIGEYQPKGSTRRSGYQLAAIESREKRGSPVIDLRSTNSMSAIVMALICALVRR